MNRLPASQRYTRRETRWKRYEKQRPGHQLQVDVKFIEPLGEKGRRKRYYQYTAINDSLACASCAPTRATAKDRHRVHRHVLSKLPFAVDQVQTDNGQEFSSALHWHLVDKGIGHIRIKPRTPRLNGKVSDLTASPRLRWPATRRTWSGLQATSSFRRAPEYSGQRDRHEVTTSLDPTTPL